MFSKLKKFLSRLGLNIDQYDEDQLKKLINSLHPDVLSLITTPRELCIFRANTIANFCKDMEICYLDYLDIGCGSGITTKYISSTLGVWGLGIDVMDTVSPLLCDNEFSFEKCNGNCIPYSDCSFKIISIINVLHHILYLKYFLKEVFRVLRKGGVLYVEEMCLNEDVTHEDISYMHKIFGCEEDVYPRSLNEWDDVIIFSGFEKEECGRYEDEYNSNYIFYVKK